VAFRPRLCQRGRVTSQPPQCLPGTDVIDLIGESGKDLDAYFDRREFEIRSWLEDQHYWHRYRKTVILQVLRGHCPDGSRPLVDLGCGAGVVATYLNQHGYRVDYADVHTEALHVARQRFQATLGTQAPAPRFIRVDITRSFPVDDYHGYLLLDVLEHLPDDVAVMRALHGRMQDAVARRAQTGCARQDRDFVLLTLPAFPALWSPWDDLEKHKRRYTLATARRLCEQAGFEVIRTTCFFFPLFFAALAVKAVRLAARKLGDRIAPAGAITDLAEGKTSRGLSGLVLGLLAPERGWLRYGNLPLGTSILLLARPRAPAGGTRKASVHFAGSAI
jgi:SAM-dependent methyltransferase